MPSRAIRGTRRRPLCVEALEDRRLLSAGPTGWTPDFIADVDGDLFTVDTNAGGRLEYLGRMDRPMHDIAFSPYGELFGIGAASGNELFRIDVAAGSPDGTIPTSSLGAITSETDPLPELTSLAFRKDGTLMATGKPADDAAHMVWIDPQTLTTTRDQVLKLNRASMFEPIRIVFPDGPLAEDNNSPETMHYVPDVEIPYDPPLLVDTVRDFVISPLGNPDGTGQAVYFTDAVQGQLILVSQATSSLLTYRLGSLDIGEFEGLTYATDTNTLYGYREDGGFHRISTDGNEVAFVAQLWHSQLDAIVGATNAHRDLNDLGVVDFLDLPDQRSLDGELWYRVGVLGDRTFTVEKTSPGAAGRIALYRYDDNGDLEELATDPLRIDYPVPAGEDQYVVQVTQIGAGVDLRMANLVATDGSANQTVRVYGGSSADDRLEFTPGTPHLLDINGLLYRFDADLVKDIKMLPGIEEIVLHGDEGADRFRVADPPYRDPLALVIWERERGPEAQFDGDWGRVEIAYANTRITVLGHGGQDTAVFSGLGGARMYFEAGPTEARMRYFVPQMISYPDGPTVNAIDLTLGPLWSPWSFEHLAVGFEEVDAGNGRGTLSAELYDSPGDDRLLYDRWGVTLSGEGYWLRVTGSSDLQAHSTGGHDVAELHGSAEDDLFVATPTYAGLSRKWRDVQVWNFDEVEAHAGPGGVDVAKLYDSPGDDLLVTTPTYAGLWGEGFKNEARGFDATHAYATAGGVDVAKMFDSTGDDFFHADPSQGALYRPGLFYNRAKYFDGVHAYATAGGYDVARLVGSDGDDRFHAGPLDSALYSTLYGAAFYNRAKHFEEVYAQAGAAGDDRALLWTAQTDGGTDGGPLILDRLSVDANRATLLSVAMNSLLQAIDFDYVRAVANEPGGVGDGQTATLNFVLSMEGPWDTTDLGYTE